MTSSDRLPFSVVFAAFVSSRYPLAGNAYCVYNAQTGVRIVTTGAYSYQCPQQVSYRPRKRKKHERPRRRLRFDATTRADLWTSFARCPCSLRHAVDMVSYSSLRRAATDRQVNSTSNATASFQLANAPQPKNSFKQGNSNRRSGRLSQSGSSKRSRRRR